MLLQHAYCVSCLCRRDSLVGARKPALATGVSIPPAQVRRSRRRAPTTVRLGDFEDPKDMTGDEESATTQTSDDYGPG